MNPVGYDNPNGICTAGHESNCTGCTLSGKLNTVGCDKKIKGLAGPVFNKKRVS